MSSLSLADLRRLFWGGGDSAEAAQLQSFANIGFSAASLARGELGYAERVTDDTTTNTVIGSAPANKISGLAVTVVGSGKAVDIEVFCAAAYHTVANTYAGLAILQDGAQIQLVQTSSPATANGRVLYGKVRKVLTAGQSYTFEVGKYCGAVGTATFAAAAGFPMSLVVTER